MMSPRAPVSMGAVCAFLSGMFASSLARCPCTSDGVDPGAEQLSSSWFTSFCHRLLLLVLLPLLAS